MSDCRRYREDLKALADGEISASERQTIELHLESCAACRKEASAMKFLSEEFRSVAEAPLNPALRARILANLPPDLRKRAGSPLPNSRWSFGPRLLFGGTATLAAASVFLYVFWNSEAAMKTASMEQLPGDSASSTQATASEKDEFLNTRAGAIRPEAERMASARQGKRAPAANALAEKPAAVLPAQTDKRDVAYAAPSVSPGSAPEIGKLKASFSDGLNTGKDNALQGGEAVNNTLSFFVASPETAEKQVAALVKEAGGSPNRESTTSKNRELKALTVEADVPAENATAFANKLHATFSASNDTLGRQGSRGLGGGFSETAPAPPATALQSGRSAEALSDLLEGSLEQGRGTLGGAQTPKQPQGPVGSQGPKRSRETNPPVIEQSAPHRYSVEPLGRSKEPALNLQRPAAQATSKTDNSKKPAAGRDLLRQERMGSPQPDTKRTSETPLRPAGQFQDIQPQEQKQTDVRRALAPGKRIQKIVRFRIRLQAAEQAPASNEAGEAEKPAPKKE